jgi:hypothetical protein
MSEATARVGWSAASAGALAVLYFFMARGLQSSAAVLGSKAKNAAGAMDKAVPCPRSTPQGVSSQGGEDVR